MIERALITLSRSALQHNLSLLRKKFPQQKILAMIKANAYGHGLLEIAGLLEGADALGVAYLNEAERLRAAGFTQRVVVMTGFGNMQELQRFSELGLDSVVHSAEQLELLSHANLESPIYVWLKLDSGMHRLGFYESEFLQAAQRLQQSSNVSGVTAMTHLAGTDAHDQTKNIEQLSMFQQACATLGMQTSIANTGALLGLADVVLQSDWIRPGMALYGVSPFADGFSAEFDLQPVMQLSARLIAVKTLQPGDTVGYGRTWTATQNTRYGIVALGYGDGYPRQFKSDAYVMLNGQRCAVIGCVSMDMLAIELSEELDVAVGDEVIIWNDDLSVAEVADAADISVYELLARLSRRVKREVV